MTSPESPSEWRWLWQSLRPLARYQAAALSCVLSASALGLTGPLLMRWLIDDVLPNGRWRALGAATLAFFLIYVTRQVLVSASNLLTTMAVQRLMFNLRVRLLKQLQCLPAAFYGRHPVGDLMQRVEQDVGVVGHSGSDVVPSVMRMSVDTMMTVSAMVFLDWRLALIILPLVPIFAYLRYHFRVILRRASEEVRDRNGQQSSLLNELLTGAVQVQLLGAEQRLVRRYGRLALLTMRSLLAQRRQEVLFTLLAMSFIGLGTALVIGYGGTRVITGSMTPGSLVAFYSFIGNIFAPMNIAIELSARLTRVRVSIRRLIDLEESPTLTRDLDHAAELPSVPTGLVCSNVRFGYSPQAATVRGVDYSPQAAALRGIDFRVRAGERVAIVGESGCGKSSLLKLIPRLYDVCDGSVEIDGLDVRTLELRSLRRTISVVPQEPFLFQGTLRDNLRHGAPAARPEEIEDAARIACLTEVVARLPNGWDSPLGPMGSGLSGGEKQRLAIARSLLQRRPILILDEATSALDGPTEYRLFDRLRRWCDQRVVIVVSHRLAAARWATRIVVMADGEIVETGTHETLFRPGTHYYALWQHGEYQEADGYQLTR
jgi:ABC-type multidrug transport system fused ATPase/permease subunit